MTPTSLHLLLDSSSPGVLSSASIPLSLRVPLENSSCDVVNWFPQRVSYPCPSASFKQDFSRFLVRCFPQFHNTHFIIPSYSKNASELSVYKTKILVMLDGKGAEFVCSFVTTKPSLVVTNEHTDQWRI